MCSIPTSVALVKMKNVEKFKLVNLRDMAEVLAIRFGLERALNYGLNNLVIESDSSKAIAELAKNGETMWE
ncbi:hypothetical protein REPUB_Repub05bG0122400 [Reevesia pubescens]